MMFARWTATVFTLRPSFVAIARFDSPSQISRSTSSSRRDNPWSRSPFNVTGRVSFGSSTVSPAAAFLTAVPRSRSRASLRMYPRAPESSACRTSVASLCMLSISTAVCGARCSICLVAVRPEVPGIAQSMTTTCGFNDAARVTASSPSLASPTTAIAGSSSSSRRKPRRTSVWSSTSSTVILVAMSVLAFNRDLQTHERSPLSWLEKFDRPTQHLRPLSHRDDTESAAGGSRVGALSMIFHVQLDHVTLRTQPYPGLLRFGMPGDIVQRLLHHSIHVNRRRRVDGDRRSVALVEHVQPSLTLDRREIPVNRAFETRLLED